MKPAVSATVGWSPGRVGGELASTFTCGRARIAFGCGPAQAAHDLPGRAARLLLAYSGALSAVRWCEQVHSAILASLSSDPRHPLAGAASVGRGDGLLSAEAGLGLLVWTADCVPVVAVGRDTVAVLHAGWRGCAHDILGRGLRRFELEYGESPDGVELFLGPAIDRCHYQVGAEVVEALAALVPTSGGWADHDRVDLRHFLTARALRAGVDPSSIHRIGPCTACTRELASYRRDGTQAGRQWSLVFLTPSAAPLS